MCRMLGCLAPPLPFAELVSKPPHSLVVQSYRPREMTSGYQPGFRALPSGFRRAGAP